MTDYEIANYRVTAMQQAAFVLGAEAQDVDKLLRRAEQILGFFLRGEPRTNLDQL